MNTAKSKICRYLLCQFSIVVCFVSFGASAQAAELTINVTDVNGSPIEKAKVCVRKAADNQSLASELTKNDGSVLFKVKESQVIVTVSMTGYQGQQRSLSLYSTTAVTNFALVKGQGGPVCMQLPAALQSLIVQPAVKISSFRINDGQSSTKNPTVTLSFTYTGKTPTHYRVSRSMHFPDAPWQIYNPDAPAPTYTFTNVSVYGYQNLWLQLKTDAMLAPVSEPKDDGIQLEPSGLKTFVLQGEELKSFLKKAKDYGYGFSFTHTSGNTTSECGFTIAIAVDLDLPGVRTGYLSGNQTLSGEAHFLQTKRLRSFWKILNVNLTRGSPFQTESEFSLVDRPFGNDDPAFTIDFTMVSGGGTCGWNQIRVNTITLEGPDTLSPDNALTPPLNPISR